MRSPLGSKQSMHLFAIAVLVVGMALGTTGCGNKDAKAPKPSAKSVATKAKPAVKSGWAVVTATDGSIYFGKLVETDHTGIVFLDDAYFVTKGSEVADSNTLRRFGTEVHKPLPAIEFPRTAILFAQPLAAKSPAVDAIEKFEKESPAKASASVSAAEDGTYAVFLRDGQVFFGKIALGSDSMTLTGAHYLSFKNQAKAELGEIASLNDVTLVPQSKAVVAPTGTMEIPLTSVLYFQPLAKDSPVVKALQKP